MSLPRFDYLEAKSLEEAVAFLVEHKGKARVLAGGKFPLKTIRVHPLKGRSLAGKIKAILSLPSAVWEAMSILRKFRPDIVLGVGGYASGPALMAAYLLGIKRAIQEQNVVPGMTNRILKRFSRKIFVSFEETRNFFPERKTIVTGNPIRKEFLNVLSAQREGRRHKEKGKFILFIFGGSAGAHRINGAMIESLDLLAEIQSSLRVIHQTGREDFEFVSKGYQQKGFEAVVKPFFEDMAVHYEESDLVISRAGAGTISELAVCGKPAILVLTPMPPISTNCSMPGDWSNWGRPN